MKRMSSGIRLVLIWLAIGGATYFGVQTFESQRERSRIVVGAGVIELQRSADGHFHWPGRVGRIEVEFLVDTGATTTTLPLAVAERAGLVLGAPMSSDTAGGTVRGHEARADLSLDGGVRIDRKRVVVLPDLATPLLGMDVLSKLQFTQRGDVLRFEPGAP